MTEESGVVLLLGDENYEKVIANTVWGEMEQIYFFCSANCLVSVE